VFSLNLVCFIKSFRTEKKSCEIFAVTFV